MNLFSNIPNDLPEELTSKLLETDSIRIERIVSQGHDTGYEGDNKKWYDQNQNEWVLIIEGSAILEFDDGREVEMKIGDHIDIPAHKRHRVKWTEPVKKTIWLAIFY